jgi:hypothetical protein
VTDDVTSETGMEAEAVLTNGSRFSLATGGDCAGPRARRGRSTHLRWLVVAAPAKPLSRQTLPTGPGAIPESGRGTFLCMKAMRDHARQVKRFA